MSLQVRYFSAAWCKRCVTLKPDFIEHCKILGVEPEWIDFDSLDDDSEMKRAIEALPTMMVRAEVTAPWEMYTASTFNDFKIRSSELSLTATITDGF